MDKITSSVEAVPARFLSGVEAIVQGILAQGEADRRRGLRTAGFISGYRGSPLGILDLELWQAKSKLEEYRIRFQSGLNEDLAATACWGTQQAAAMPDPKYDGVFSFWYGKGPGVDRSGDAIKHGNLAGTSAHGGVALLAGDDHGAKSSSTPHQSEQAFVAASIPVFNPATIQEYVELLPVAIELSRFASVWVGFKCMTETVESSATLLPSAQLRTIVRPEDIIIPAGGFHISLVFSPPKLDESLHLYRLPAAKAFVRANGLDRVTRDASQRTLGIVAPGKSHVDVVEALRLLRIDEQQAQNFGIRIFKPLLTWPIEPSAILDFCRGHREVIVVEEKMPLVEQQLAQLLLRLPASERPDLTGKTTLDDKPLLPDYGELSPVLVAFAIGTRLIQLGLGGEGLRERLNELEARGSAVAKRSVAATARAPMFCSGCPHSRSTRLPEGSMAFGGIGCHGMAMWVPELKTLPPTHMGAEGANWIGIEGYAGPEHIFQNMGDGTYAHSGVLAIRAAIAAKSNITFKILYNAAVAMTGGQPVEGDLDAGAIARQVFAEGAVKVALVSEEPAQFTDLPPQIRVYHRDALDSVQREMRATKGVTSIIYDQGCAAERRRLRKQGLYPDLPIRTVINPEVCEGCGDCNEKSACVSVVPIQTEFGTKRAIDQESCNKDYTCTTGFCPSFITVKGGALKRNTTSNAIFAEIDKGLVDPVRVPPTAPYNILIAGIGGTGVITLGSTLARAAAIEGKSVLTFDVTGVSQKNGAVFSHVRVLGAESPDAYRPRIPREQLDLLLGCDVVAATSAEAIQLFDREKTRVVASAGVVPTGSFQRDPEYNLNIGPFTKVFEQTLKPENIDVIAPSPGVQAVLGQGPLLNVYLVGQAYQKGYVPIGGAAIEAAIAEGGSAQRNILAFRLGRLSAIDARKADALFEQQRKAPLLATLPLEQALARCKEILTSYQSASYADAYERFVRNVADRDPRGQLTLAVTTNLFKLMRYKDEYEVARLHTAPEFLARLRQDFDGDYKLHLNLAPPVLSRLKSDTGEPRKYEFGPYMFRVLKFMRAFKFLRGTPFDPFGYSHDRKLERELINEYKGSVLDILPGLTDANYEAACEIARLPETMKGYGHIKERNVQAARKRAAELLQKFRSGMFGAAAPPQDPTTLHNEIGV